jgi:hypothetical protein
MMGACWYTTAFGQAASWANTVSGHGYKRRATGL